MLNTNRIDSIVFDLKQSIDDLSNELKVMMESLNTLNRQFLEKITEKENI
jgi:hypothetical protein